MTKFSFCMKVFAFCIFCSMMPIALPAQEQAGASSSTAFTTLLSFCSQGGAMCADGEEPYAALVQGTDGNLYGTTNMGGMSGYGTVFSITADGTLTTLHSFSYDGDGGFPYAGLVLSTNGRYFGTTYFDGTHGGGTIFQIDSTGTLATVYGFRTMEGGKQPYGGLVQGSNGDFYGTTYAGETYGDGVVFSIAAGKPLTTLYDFRPLQGAHPNAALIQGSDGNFYGTTSHGGTSKAYLCETSFVCGTVFKITPSGSLSRLYSFCSQTNCADGASPDSALLQEADGSFYGTTELGGAYDRGTIFKITPGGALTTIYNFCSQGGAQCTDGENPVAGLVQGTDGNLYGTTAYGGTSNSCDFGCGTVFSVTPSGTLTTLHSFDDADGATPIAGLVQETDGNFYGTTLYGGASDFCTGSYGQAGCGTVFSLSAGLGPFVEAHPTSGVIGEPINILGTDLTGATKVTFHGIASGFTVVSSSQITTSVPTGATTGTVKVVTPGGTLSSNISFTVN